MPSGLNAAPLGLSAEPGAESPAVRIRPLDALEQLLGGLGLDVPLAAHLLRRAPVVNHLGLALGLRELHGGVQEQLGGGGDATTNCRARNATRAGSDRARRSRRRRAGGLGAEGVRVLVHQRARGVLERVRALRVRDRERAGHRAAAGGERAGTEATATPRGREGERERGSAREGNAVGRPGATEATPAADDAQRASAANTARRRIAPDRGRGEGAGPRGRTTRRARGKAHRPRGAVRVQEAGARRGADDARHHVGDFPDRLLSCDTSVRYQGGPPRRFSVTD